MTERDTNRETEKHGEQKITKGERTSERERLNKKSEKERDRESETEREREREKRY